MAFVAQAGSVRNKEALIPVSSIVQWCRQDAAGLLPTGRGNAFRAAEADTIANTKVGLSSTLTRGGCHVSADWLSRQLPPRGTRCRVLCAVALKRQAATNQQSGIFNATADIASLIGLLLAA